MVKELRILGSYPAAVL